MKKQNVSNLSSTIKNILSSTILATVLMFSASAFAADKKLEIVSPVEIKYLGQLNDQPLFQINIDNQQQENVYVNLEDENGNILYSDKFNEARFSKKFQFDYSHFGGTKLRLSLTSNSFKKKQVFEINNQTKVVTEVVVTKID